MSRYIDADALMEDICSLYRDEDHIDYNVAIADALNVIDEQPTVDIPQWIPCSERLPEENGRYLVTNSAWGAMKVDWNAWMDGAWLYPNTKPIAWMPLPEPWKGEADEQIR